MAEMELGPSWHGWSVERDPVEYHLDTEPTAAPLAELKPGAPCAASNKKAAILSREWRLGMLTSSDHRPNTRNIR